MSFLKQLLNPFIEFEEAQKPAVVPKPPVTAYPQANKNEEVHHPLIPDTPIAYGDPAQKPIQTQAPAIVAQADYNKYFEELINKANQENSLFAGADYKEFVDAKVDIDDIADETLKYTTAFNILKSAGITRDKLVSTGREYLNIIGRDLNAFQTAHSQRYKKELTDKEQALQKKAEKLQILTQQLNALKTEINQLSLDINQTKNSLNQSKNSFLLAGEKKQQEIQAELDKIIEHF